MFALTGELFDDGPASGLLPQPFEYEGGPDAPHVGGNRSAVVDRVDDDRLGASPPAGDRHARACRGPARERTIGTASAIRRALCRTFAAAFDDLQIGTTAGGFLAEVHGRLISSQHMIATYATIIKRYTQQRGTTFLRNTCLLYTSPSPRD